ncbi:unnamed protein product [Dracunculus medinensis]|uniref:snRNA-activating protein complex subunit 3 n=1 Tax=Dracunculus medinensis TaxID=318479 RepID=A0A0N4U2J3_DRAME|nr:unnamed protein product [Dracunculus medinensis]
MSMEKQIVPDEHEFISPLVNFNAFKEDAIAKRDRLRAIVGLKPLRDFIYPDDIPKANVALKESINTEIDTSDDDINKIIEIFAVSEEEAKETVANMNLEHLAVTNRRDIMFRPNVAFEDVPADTELETLNAKEIDLNIRRHISCTICYANSLSKYSDYFENELRKTRSTGYGEAVVNDFVVTLTICRPFNRQLEFHEKKSIGIRPYWKFLLRGETTLVEMHSLFKCTSDFGLTFGAETKENPELKDFTFFKYPSSFIFIHDTFYIADAYRCFKETLVQIDQSKLMPLTDISEPIRSWMKKKKNEFGPTEVKNLGNHKVKDITCRLGFPYVYVHQGNCEHVFFFTDLRLMDIQDYPIGFPQKLSDNSIENRCKVCRHSIAGWIIEDDSLPTTPFHICDNCYKQYLHTNKHHKLKHMGTKNLLYMDPSVLQF